MNLYTIAPPTSITLTDQIPPGYLERIALEIADAGSALVHLHNNLLRILLLLQRADVDTRDSIIERLVILIFVETAAFDAAQAEYLQGIIQEVAPQRRAKKEPKP